MRKDIERNIQKTNINKMLFTSGGIISLIIIIVAIGVFVYGNKNAENSKIADLNSSDITSLVEGGTKTSEQASSQVGKSINEVKEESNVLVVDTEEDTNKNEVQEIQEKEVTTKTTKNTESTDKNTENKKQATVEKKADPVFSMPVEGEIIKEYAKDKLVYSDTLKEWVTHAGIDIKADKTTVVKASEEGTVKSIKNDPRYRINSSNRA